MDKVELRRWKAGQTDRAVEPAVGADTTSFALLTVHVLDVTPSVSVRFWPNGL